MIETLLVVLLMVVAMMTIGIYKKTSEQAQALKALDAAAKDWLAMQIRRERRQMEGVTYDKEKALRWLSDLVGVSVADVGQIYSDYRGMEVVLDGDEQTTVFVTALPKDKLLRELDKGVDRLETRVAPSIPRRARAFSAGLSPDWVYFDLEAEAAGRALGLDWGKPARLWVWRW